MSSVPALDRTVALLRGDLFPTLDPDVLAAELTSTSVLLRANETNLVGNAAQTAVVSSFVSLAQMGYEVILDVPEVPLLYPQPPLKGSTLRSALLDLGSDLITPARTGPATDTDAQILIGDTAAEGIPGEVIRVGGGPWSAALGIGADSRVRRLADELPVGAVLTGIACAAEVTRIVARRIAHRHGLSVAREFDIGGPREVSLSLPPLDLPEPLDAGELDFISAGAITNGCFFVLLRVPRLRALARVIDDDTAEESNLNRYPLLRRSLLGRMKVGLLASLSIADFRIEQLPLRFGADDGEPPPALRPRVLVGVDDIPSRWEVQRFYPEWLCVAGTSHFAALVSEHADGTACAGCLHPRDDPDAPAELPTISFTSMLAGALQDYRLLAHMAWSPTMLPTLAPGFNLGAPYALTTLGQAARSDCPVGCPASREQKAR